MQPYEFSPNSAELIQQPGGQWIAKFKASTYTNQSFNETSNYLDPGGLRHIEFEVTGNEINPVIEQDGSSAPYTKGTETEVELVLKRDGKVRNTIRTSY